MGRRGRYLYSAAFEKGGKMDSGRRTVLISVVGIIAAIGLMVGVGFGVARRVGNSVRSLERPTIERTTIERASQEGRYMGDLVDFDTVYTEGGWSVTIAHGDEYSVEVEASEKALEQLSVFTRGSTLHLELDSGIQSVTGKVQATVFLPDLERLQTAGHGNVVISGFDLDALDITVDGAASITALDGSVDDLTIDSDGAASFDFGEFEVGNAQVEMDGASSLSIMMDGGALTGVLRGLGDVTFSGEVAEESIRIDGLGRVRRR
jgi:Putative auto-transporter adhesin, head GIN domain